MRPKKTDLMTVIRDCVARGRYYDTRQAKKRKKSRGILTRDVVYVLNNGYHQRKKDKFDAVNEVWNYSIRAHVLHADRTIRVVVSFDEDHLVVITAIHIVSKRK